MCHSYGGDKGGFVGNITVVAGDAWPLDAEWQHYQTIVPLKLTGYEQVGVLPVLSAPDPIWLDDFAAYELEDADALRATVARQRSRLKETLADQVQVGHRQRALLDYLLAEAEKLEASLATGQLAAATADRVAALEYVTPRVKSVIEFGDTGE